MNNSIGVKIIVLLLWITLLPGCMTSSSATWETAPIASPRVVLTVFGLSCPLCSNNLDGQLKALSGVKKADINLQTGAVTVELNEGHAVSPADIDQAVKNAGFTLKSMETP